MLSYRASPEEHTYINLTVNVAVCEKWVLSNKFMKGPGVRRIRSTRGEALRQPSIGQEFV